MKCTIRICRNIYYYTNSLLHERHDAHNFSSQVLVDEKLVT